MASHQAQLDHQGEPLPVPGEEVGQQPFPLPTIPAPQKLIGFDDTPAHTDITSEGRPP